jgi:hypothetical protein
MIRRGFTALARSLRHRHPTADVRWERIVHARDTLKVLDEETLETCRTLVMAVAEMDAQRAA